MTFPFAVFCHYSEQFFVSQAEQFSDGLSGQKQSFTTDDARKMITSFNSFEEEIQSLLSSQKAIMAEVNKYASAIMNSAVFSDNVIDDLRRGIKRYPKTFDSSALISSLYNYVCGRPFVQDCKVLQSQYQQQIKQNISALQVATSSLRWVFTSGKNKAEAATAYSNLADLQGFVYGPGIKRAVESVQAVGHASEDEKASAFEAESSTYRSALKQCAEFDVNSFNPPTAISTLITRHQAIIDKYQLAYQDGEKKVETAKKDVKSCVDKMLTQLLMKQLREYDVDIISQKRSGLRTKALKDAGYGTVEDVYCATVSNLASVHGISQDSARQIKDAVREIAANVQTGLKLKISTDERSDEATGLVRALFAYQKYVQTLNSAKDGFSQQEHIIKTQLPIISALKNNLYWLFATDNERDSYIRAYRILSDILASSYPNDVSTFQAEVSNIRRFLFNEVWDDFAQNSISYFNTLEEIAPGVLGNGDTLYGLPEDLAREIQDQTFFPQGLKVTLRRYQEWGVKYILHQEKALLGDEMGLGKTVQAIATMVSLRNTGATHFLVICPASVLPNWCKEIDKKSEFRSTKIHGSNRQSALDEWIESGGVAVTTYETTNILKLPYTFHYDLLVVDEAHYIKNEEARRSKSVRAFGAKAKRILFMTGTALENKVEEMISLIQVLQPAIASRIKDIAFMSSAPQFREQIAPVYYRRKREDVLSELPEITETKEWCDLFPEEESAYEAAVLQKNRSAIRKVSWTSDDLSRSSKARRMKEIIEAAQEDGRKVLVFSFYLETIRKIRDFLGSRCTQPINGSVSVERRQEIIDEFDTMPAGSVLLAQIQAGGTGLNIQSASVVIICEPQLKPSIENQAISRAYRMGQTRKVLVYRLLAANTIDERIDEMLEEKQMIFDAFADKSAAAQATTQEESTIDDKTLGKLILEEIDRINAKNGNNPKPETTAAQEAERQPVVVNDSAEPVRRTVMVEAPVDIEEPSEEIAAEISTMESRPDTASTVVRESAKESDTKKSNVEVREKNALMSFPNTDTLLEYIVANHIEFKDNRPKNGCLWIKADSLQEPDRIRVDGRKLMYSKASKALNGAAGWYIS